MPPTDLPHWDEWVSALPDGKSPKPLGFTCGFAHLSRARARYRVAVSYRGLLLDGFRQPTTDAYSGLVGLVLAFGAFEQYAKGLGLKKSLPRSKWFAAFVPADADSTIRAHDPKGVLFNLISSKTHADVFEGVQNYRAGLPYCPSVLAAAVRHVFVHGTLAASSNGAEPFQVAALSRYLAQVVLDGVSRDFEKRVGVWQHSLKALP